MEIARGQAISAPRREGLKSPGGAAVIDESAPPIRVEIVDARAMLRLEPAWSNLLDRVLEPNVFLDPGFLLPLIQHVSLKTRPDFVLAWEESSATSFGNLIGLLPVTFSPAWRKALPRFAWGFHHSHIALGTPLLDRIRGEEALDAILRAVKRRDPSLSGMILSAVPIDGAFAAALRAVCATRDVSIFLFEEHRRAVLFRRVRQGLGTAVSLLSAKRRKEMRRKRRRLEEYGPLTYRSASTPDEIRGAAERFLALEYSGWKGRAETALLSNPSIATFTRTMTRMMAHEGRCRIDSLEVNGQPVAMGIVLTAGPRAHFWKTAFDERYRRLSPGVQFALALTRAQAEGTQAVTDSCAIPHHPMIDRIWPDRMAVADVFVELRPDGVSEAYRQKRLATAVRFENSRRRVRAFAKAMVKTVVRTMFPPRS